MNIFNRNRYKVQAQEMTAKAIKLESEVGRYRKVQELLVDNILALQEKTTGYKGNEYQSYDQAVQAISDKYNSKADWGCLQTGTIIDLRSAFILGEGIKVLHRTATKKEAENEMKWVEDFFSWNDLDAEMAQEIVKEAEIEGKAAIKLIYEEEEWRGRPGMVSARYISWLTKKYKIETNPQDYLDYTLLKWTPTGTTAGEELKPNQFIYKKFGGRLNNPNEAQPKIMKCLTQIDRLDKALRDLREINHLYAAPTPDFECEDEKQVNGLLKYIENTNWKIGKSFVHTGKFEMKGVDPTGVVNLISEIELNVKLISGTTGIPIHFLGLLDLLRNRATGDNTRELVMAATAKERKVWEGAFMELIEKAMIMFNEKSGEGQKSTKLDPGKIKVEIPLITQEHWDRIEKVLIPAKMAGIVSKEYVASQIPGVDMEDEQEKQTVADKKQVEKDRIQFENLKQGLGEIE